MSWCLSRYEKIFLDVCFFVAKFTELNDSQSSAIDLLGVLKTEIRLSNFYLRNRYHPQMF